MLQELILFQESDRVSNYINDHVKLVGADRRDEVIGLFENTYRIFPHWVITICPKMHPDIHYVSQNCSFVLGHTRDYLVANSSLDKFIKLVHEEDQEDVFKCINRVHTSLREIPSEEHYKHRVIFHYRFLNGNGEYMHVHDEKTSLRLKDSGNLYYVLFRDITKEKPFKGVSVEFFRQDETLNKIWEYRPGADRAPLTPREKDLILLLRQGLSVKEVAWRLEISPNTVRNIKSKLFEKYNVSNSIELLNITG